MGGFVRDRFGGVSAEYALITALIGSGVFCAAYGLTNAIVARFNETAAALGAAPQTVAATSPAPGVPGAAPAGAPAAASAPDPDKGRGRCPTQARCGGQGKGKGAPD